VDIRRALRTHAQVLQLVIRTSATAAALAFWEGNCELIPGSRWVPSMTFFFPFPFFTNPRDCGVMLCLCGSCDCELADTVADSMFFKKNSRVTRLKENNNRSFSIFYHLRCASAIISFPFQIFSFYVLLCIEVLLTTCFFKNRTKRISRIVLRSCVMNLCIKYCTWRILPDKDNII